MRVLITGSSGLIGSALMPALAAAGHDVVRLLRGTGGPSGNLHWDPAAGTIDDLSGIDAVIHLAGVGIGEKRWSEEQKRAILESRTVGTRLVAEAMAAATPRPSVMVSSSAIAVYGNPGDAELTEESPAADDYLADVVVQWEAAARPAADAGIRVVYPRTGIVLSSRGGALDRMLLPFKLGLGGRVGPGTQWMSWISMADEIAALIHLLEGDLSGPVNLTAPNPATNLEFVKTLGSVLNRPTLLPTPLLPVKARFGAELVESLLLYSQRIVGVKLLESGFEFQHLELRGALEAAVAGD
ncbi:MAG: TIGR01777 family protein [Acidimicrobiia bacterium]|nr:TIGR01777 family oxidoreductase [Acidimicrobiia bacterium]NNL14169.1 TIGR01777 family protein [Acidimicrobiia bacterium]